MSTGTHVSTRRAGFIAAIIAVAAMLGGCSASSASPESLDYGGDDAGGFAEPAYDAERGDGNTLFSEEDGAPVTQTSTAERSLIITGEMYMTVEDPILAADRAEGIVQVAGGRIDARNETAPEGKYGGEAWLTLRIPAAKLDDTVDKLRELGTVDQFATNSYDVTVQVTDLAAKISTLRASTARIEALLNTAKDIDDIIKLESELDRRQSELESLEAQQRGLTDQVSMSTIYLSLTTEPVVIVEVDDSPDSFWDGLVKGWNSVVDFLSAALIGLGVILPWLALIGIVLLIVIATYRARRSRRTADATEPLAMAAPPAPKRAPAKK